MSVKKTVEGEILIVWVYELEEIINILYMNHHAWLNELGLEEGTRKSFDRGIIVKLVMYSLFRITNTHESYILIKKGPFIIIIVIVVIIINIITFIITSITQISQLSVYVIHCRKFVRNSES